MVKKTPLRFFFHPADLVGNALALTCSSWCVLFSRELVIWSFPKKPMTKNIISSQDTTTGSDKGALFEIPRENLLCPELRFAVSWYRKDRRSARCVPSERWWRILSDAWNTGAEADGTPVDGCFVCWGSSIPFNDLWVCVVCQSTVILLVMIIWCCPIFFVSQICNQAGHITNCHSRGLGLGLHRGSERSRNGGQSRKLWYPHYICVYTYTCHMHMNHIWNTFWDLPAFVLDELFPAPTMRATSLSVLILLGPWKVFVDLSHLMVVSIT